MSSCRDRPSGPGAAPATVVPLSTTNTYRRCGTVQEDGVCRLRRASQRAHTWPLTCPGQDERSTSSRCGGKCRDRRPTAGHPDRQVRLEADLREDDRIWPSRGRRVKFRGVAALLLQVELGAGHSRDSPVRAGRRSVILALAWSPRTPCRSSSCRPRLSHRPGRRRRAGPAGCRPGAAAGPGTSANANPYSAHPARSDRRAVLRDRPHSTWMESTTQTSSVHTVASPANTRMHCRIRHAAAHSRLLYPGCWGGTGTGAEGECGHAAATGPRR
jgi:hypothetical protein